MEVTTEHASDGGRWFVSCSVTNESATRSLCQCWNGMIHHITAVACDTDEEVKEQDSS